VASGVGGVPELIVDGITGLLVPPSDPGALAEALRRVVSEGDLAASLGAAAATRSRRYTADAVVPRIEAVYAAVSGSRVTDSASAPDEDPERVAAA
jgi:glycosyltransferase involved in cell wall biosynthesis